MSGICGRMRSVNSVRIRTISRRSSLSNSRMRLFASTMASGSMKTVLPVADSSCTMPRILRLKAGATGITNRPSRMVGATSLSTSPSDCAERRIDCRLREMLPVVAIFSRRMRASSADALSFICPYRSSMPSICRTRAGKTGTPAASAANAG